MRIPSFKKLERQAAQLSPSQGFRHDPRRHSGSILASKIMASPAFGFSVGDFIAAVELITKIATALKDVGGAAHDSQVLIGELELLKTLLARIVPSSEDTLTQKCDPAVKAQADRTLKTLDEFAKSISKFDPKLGKTAPKGWHRGTSRKVQFAVRFASRIQKLRAVIATRRSYK